MLKKISLILSVSAALGFAVVTAADAKGGGKHGGGHHGGGHHGGGHHGGGHHGEGHHGGGHHNRGPAQVNRSAHVSKNARMHENRPANKHYIVGRTYNGHIWFGHGGHRWHGRWYAYGVGPCWIYVDGLWFWNPLACPL
jgi:hypothetical protein